MHSSRFWLELATGFEATSAVFGHQISNSLRARNYRWRLETCARRSRVRDLGLACLGRLPTCNARCMSALASPLRRRHRLSRGLSLGTFQNIERFGCDQHDHVSFSKAWMLTLRTPWITISVWSHREEGRHCSDAWNSCSCRRCQHCLVDQSRSWLRCGPNLPRAMVVRASGLLSWLLTRLLLGQLSTCMER